MSRDMARAIEWAIGRSSDHGGRFLVVNAGNQTGNYQVRELAEVVSDELPGTKVSINRDAPPDKRSYQVDFSLFASLAPEHVPQVSLKQSVQNSGVGFAPNGIFGRRVSGFALDATSHAEAPH